MVYFNSISTDFFGPEANHYQDFIGEVPIKHLIPHCGERILNAINALVQDILKTERQPQWQRNDGSLIYDKLPWNITYYLKKSDLDEKGYINLSKVHIFSLEALQGASEAQVNDIKSNQCPSCFGKKEPIQRLFFCPALACKFVEGTSFDIRRHRKYLQSGNLSLELKGTLETTPIKMILNGEISTHFKIAWRYLDSLSSPKQRDPSSYLLGFLFIACVSIFSIRFLTSR